MTLVPNQVSYADALNLICRLSDKAPNPRYTKEIANQPRPQRTESPYLPCSEDDLRKAFVLAHPGLSAPKPKDIEDIYSWLTQAQSKCDVMYGFVMRDRRIIQRFTIHDLPPRTLWTHLTALQHRDTLMVHTRPPARKYADVKDKFETMARHLLAFTVNIPQSHANAAD